MNLQFKHAVVLFCCAMSASVAVAAATITPAPTATPVPVGPWPRQVVLSNAVAVIYQPQINSWTDNRLEFRSAVAIKRKGVDNDAFGVIFATTRTNVDKASH